MNITNSILLPQNSYQYPYVILNIENQQEPVFVQDQIFVKDGPMTVQDIPITRSNVNIPCYSSLNKLNFLPQPIIQANEAINNFDKCVNENQLKEKNCCHICNLKVNSQLSLITHYLDHENLNNVKDLIIDKFVNLETTISDITSKNDDLSKYIQSLEKENSLLKKKIKSLEPGCQENRLKENKNHNLVLENVECKEEILEDDNQQTDLKASGLRTSYKCTDIANDRESASECDKTTKEVKHVFKEKCKSKSIKLQNTLNKTVNFKKSTMVSKSNNNKKLNNSVSPINKTAVKSKLSDNVVKKKKKKYPRKIVATCLLCNKNYYSTTIYSQHLEKHVIKGDAYKCSVCPDYLFDKKMFESHFKMHDSKEWPYNCGFCGKTFNNLIDRNTHAEQHFEDNSIQCDLCNVTSKTRKELSRHIKKHFNSVKLFECNDCGKKYNCKFRLKAHVLFHLTNGLAYYCKICSKSFQDKSNLNVHMKRHQNEAYKHTCDICKKSFSLRCSLEDHKLRHTVDPYGCRKCNESFSSFKDLNFHKITVHSKRELHKCTFCDKLFASKAHMLNHRRVHTGEKTFLCSYCGKYYHSETALKLHILIHTGGNRFQCDFCKQYIAHKEQLRRHIMKHTGYKPYICHFCGKGCSERGNLTQHMRSHTKEKPKVCEICGKGFLRNSFLFQHMEKNHPNNSSK